MNVEIVETEKELIFAEWFERFNFSLIYDKISQKSKASLETLKE